MCRELLDNNLLRDPAEGVNYFKNTPKKYFLKGPTSVCLYRLLSFFNHRRRNSEFPIFISKFEILLRRPKAAENDPTPVMPAQLLDFV